MLLIINRGGGVLPGTILAFSGEFDTDGYPIDKLTGFADKGWHLCDGTNGTPDLRGRFILGASDAHAVGSTGGEEATGISIANLPPHNFSGTTSTAGNHNHSCRFQWVSSSGSNKIPVYTSGDYDYTDSGTTSNHINYAGNHNHTFTTNTLGSGVAHNNMPPYYTLSYIMKL